MRLSQQGSSAKKVEASRQAKQQGRESTNDNSYCFNDTDVIVGQQQVNKQVGGLEEEKSPQSNTYKDKKKFIAGLDNYLESQSNESSNKDTKQHVPTSLMQGFPKLAGKLPYLKKNYTNTKPSRNERICVTEGSEDHLINYCEADETIQEQPKQRIGIIRGSSSKRYNLIEEHKQALREYSNNHIKNDVSYLDKTPFSRKSLSNIGNSILNFEQSFSTLQQHQRANKDNMYLKIFHANEGNTCKYDKVFERIEKKIQLDEYYTSKKQSENQFSQAHSQAIRQSKQESCDNSFQSRGYEDSNNNKTLSASGLKTQLTYNSIHSVPVSRKDVCELEAWLGQMLNSLQESSKKLKEKETIDKFQVVYQACLKELIRQVKLDCYERGHLLERVWMAYIDLIAKGKKDGEASVLRQEQSFLDEVTRVHKGYNEQIEYLREQDRKNNEKIVEQTKQIAILQETAGYLKKKLFSCDSEVKKHKKSEMDLRTQLVLLIQQNIKLKLVNSDSNDQEQKKVRNSIQKRLEIEQPNINPKDSQGNSHNRNISLQIPSGQNQNSQSDQSDNQEPQQLSGNVQSSNQFLETIQADSNAAKSAKVIKDSSMKMSVVSHLLRAKGQLIFESEENPREDRENKQIDSGDGASNLEANENNNTVVNSRKLSQCGGYNEEYELFDEEVQTDQMQYSTHPLINLLVSALIDSTEVSTDLIDSEIKPIYKKTLAALNKATSQQNGSNNSTVVALETALDQLKSIALMGNTLNLMRKECEELKKSQFESAMAFREQQAEVEQLSRLLGQFKAQSVEKEEQIEDLEIELGSVNEERNQERRNLKIFFKSLVSKTLNNQESNEQSQRILPSEKMIVEALLGSSEKIDNPEGVDNDNNEEGEDGNVDDENIREKETQEDKQIHQFIIDSLIKENTSNNGSRQQSMDISKVAENIISLVSEQLPINPRNHQYSQNKNNKNINKSLNGNMSHSQHQRQGNSSAFLQQININVAKMSSTMTKSISQTPCSPSSSSQQQYFIQPQLKNKITRRNFSANQEQSMKILAILQKQKSKIKKPELPQSTVSKFFCQVFSEMMKTDSPFKIPLHTHCYDIILQKYGLKQVAEKKLQQILKSLFCYRTVSPRFSSTALFCGMTAVQYEESSYILYIKAMKYFHEQSQEKSSMQQQQQLAGIANLFENPTIQFEKANRFIDEFFKDKFERKFFQELIAAIKQKQSMNISLSSTTAPTNTSKDTSSFSGVKFEELMELCLHFYEKTKDERKKHVSNIFYACDLDKNDSIEFYEFELMYKFVERENYNRQQIEKMFSEEADMMNPLTSERALSLNRFVDICIEKDLFSVQKCNEFAKNRRASNSEYNSSEVNSIEELRNNWETKMKELKYRFLKCNKFKAEIKGIIVNLGQQIQQQHIKGNTKEEEILWLSYRLIEEESIDVIADFEADQVIQDIFPEEFGWIHQVSLKFNENF